MNNQLTIFAEGVGPIGFLTKDMKHSTIKYDNKRSGQSFQGEFDTIEGMYDYIISNKLTNNPFEIELQINNFVKDEDGNDTDVLTDEVSTQVMYINKINLLILK